MRNLLFWLVFFILISPRIEAGVNSPQNFQLINFNAEANDQTISLKWITSDEIDLDYFIVERSTNAVEFDSIGVLSSKGTSYTWQNTYEFSDSPGNSSLYYYRLKQRGGIGADKLSRIIYVSYQSEDAFCSLYPNPNHDAFTLNYVLSEGEAAVFTIHSIRGKKLITYNVDSMHSSLFISLDLDKGIYYGDLTLSNKQSRRFKIIIN